MPDLISEWDRNEPCWCGSGKKYKSCHGFTNVSQPGAPVPADTGDGVYISPTTILARGAVQAPPGGAPIYFNPPSQPYRPAPRGLTELATKLASLSVIGGPEDLKGLGVRKFEYLESLGLDNAEVLDAQVRELPDEALGELSEETLLESRAALDMLREVTSGESPDSVIYAPEPAVERLVGRSLLWADRYLINDPLAEAALREDLSRETLARAIRQLLRLRPLIEAGLVIPIPEGVAQVATIAAVETELTSDLGKEHLLRWVESQLIVEGPTAREALFLRARDDLDRSRMYMYAHIESVSADDSVANFTTRMLGHYDPTRDYKPWIDQTKHQVAAQYIREVNESLAIAEAFGGHLMTSVPFRGRVAREKQRLEVDIGSVTAQLNVPYLDGADARTLARIASNEESVDSMRRAIRRTLREIQSHDVQAGTQAMQYLVDDLVEDATVELGRSIRRNATWGALAPGGAAGAAILLSTSPFVAGVVSVFGALAPYLAARGEFRQRPAWMFWRARKLSRRARR